MSHRSFVSISLLRFLSLIGKRRSRTVTWRSSFNLTLEILVFDRLLTPESTRAIIVFQSHS